jgi:hypothetical protein
MQLKNILSILLLFAPNLAATTPPLPIQILYTAALIDQQYEERKNEYIACLQSLKARGYTNPYIVEAIKKNSPTFLDEHSINVFYSTVNNIHLKNKGVNEGKTMLQALNHFNLDPDTMILKITGRYPFISDDLFQCIKDNPGADAIVKMDPYGQGITACFALRARYLKDMLEHLDYNRMEQNMINVELEFANYLKKIIREKNAKVIYINNLGIAARAFGTGENNSTMLYL